MSVIKNPNDVQKALLEEADEFEKIRHIKPAFRLSRANIKRLEEKFRDPIGLGRNNEIVVLEGEV